MAFHQNTDVQKINDHGTWSSDSVYTYIIADPLNANGVAQTFCPLLASWVVLYLCVCFSPGCLGVWWVLSRNVLTK